MENKTEEFEEFEKMTPAEEEAFLEEFFGDLFTSK
jgi:hypothetical protein